MSFSRAFGKKKLEYYKRKRKRLFAEKKSIAGKLYHDELDCTAEYNQNQSRTERLFHVKK